MAAPQAVHPTEQALRSYGLGQLDDRSAEAVERHLKSCRDCRRRAAELAPDPFLDGMRGAQGRPESPAPIGSSFAGLSKLDGSPRTTTPPAAETLPPGLVENPDYEVIGELGRG